MGEAQLKLQGTGLLRYRSVFKAYVAAFYLGEDAPTDDVLADVPRRLEIEYFWAIPADRFSEATIEGIGRNVDAETLESLWPRIAEFNEFYADVEPGDRYSLTYLPGRGTELALNGEPKGLVAGADFSSALFSIWIGPNPLNDGLRRQLLAIQ
ncbi:MAG: chalcone isomerase family protein [Deltaproteobacteria bacterium]|nr:chalcone isomerase family protein [Deltaproteobacteria bacterium]